QPAGVPRHGSKLTRARREHQDQERSGKAHARHLGCCHVRRREAHAHRHRAEADGGEEERPDRPYAWGAAVAPGRSSPGKKNAISARAVSTGSDPWDAFCSTSVPNSPRTVPLGAFFESVGPIRSRQRLMAFSPSRTPTKTGPEVMNFTRSPKNGRSRCTA